MHDIVKLVRQFSIANGAKPGFEINILQKSTDPKSVKVLDLYETAYDLASDEVDSGSDDKLLEIFEQLKSLIA